MVILALSTCQGPSSSRINTHSLSHHPPIRNATPRAFSYHVLRPDGLTYLPFSIPAVLGSDYPAIRLGSVDIHSGSRAACFIPSWDEAALVKAEAMEKSGRLAKLIVAPDNHERQPIVAAHTIESESSITTPTRASGAPSSRRKDSKASVASMDASTNAITPKCRSGKNKVRPETDSAKGKTPPSVSPEAAASGGGVGGRKALGRRTALSASATKRPKLEGGSTTALLEAPSPRWGHSMSGSVAGTALLFGGQGDNQELAKDSFWKLDLVTSEWARGSSKDAVRLLYPSIWPTAHAMRFVFYNSKMQCI